MKALCTLDYSTCAEWRFWSNCTNAQADQNLRWAHISKGTFSDIAVQIKTSSLPDVFTATPIVLDSTSSDIIAATSAVVKHTITAVPSTGQAFIQSSSTIPETPPTALLTASIKQGKIVLHDVWATLFWGCVLDGLIEKMSLRTAKCQNQPVQSCYSDQPAHPHLFHNTPRRANKPGSMHYWWKRVFFPKIMNYFLCSSKRLYVWSRNLKRK